MSKPKKPTRLKKVFFSSTSKNKTLALAGSIKEYYKSRGEKTPRYIEAKELQSIFKEIFSIDSMRYEVSAGTLKMEITERYFEDRELSYKEDMVKYRQRKVRKVRKSHPVNKTQKVFKAGIKREPGWLYYLNMNCDMVRSRMLRGGERRKRGERPEMLVKTTISRREKDCLYFIDKQGDVSRTKMDRDGTARKKKRKAR